MKNYEEMAESVLERRDRYVADRKRKIWKTASVVSCFCFVAVLGTGIWYAGILNNDLNITNRNAADGRYQNEEAQTGGILPGGATIGETTDNDADTKKEMQEPVGDELGEGLDGNPAGYPPLTTNAPQQSDEISETDPLDTDADEYRDAPVVQNPGSTGALIAYEAVWGGSYMDDAGRWVVLLTENTAENQKKVFELNPSLTEDNTIFKTAAYSLAYLESLMESINRAAGSNGEIPFIFTVGLREEKNCVQVCVTTDDPESIAKILAFDTFGGAIEIINMNNYVVPEESLKGPQP